ncbi:MAG: ankyrin repeat domain-containing protein [Verrucomicrobiota bacterium]
MKTNPLLLPAALCTALSLTAPVRAQNTPASPPAAPRPDTAQLLREALFEEQGVRDAEKAAAAYGKVIAAYDAERSFAATAIYRLAEVRRSQDRKDEAAVLYQRLLAEFPSHDPLARLSRENLAALGVKEVPGAIPGAGAATVAGTGDGQDARIAELKQMLKDSPDRVKGSDVNQPLWEGVESGQARVVTFLLDAGARADGRMLASAAANGHLGVCEALLARGVEVNGRGALNSAVSQDRLEVVRLLLEKGADPQGTALAEAVSQGRTEMARLLLEKGADPNFVEKEKGNNPLFSAIRAKNKEILDLLMAAKASPNLPPPAKSPLYFAVKTGDTVLAKQLMELGADTGVRCFDSWGAPRQVPGGQPGFGARKEPRPSEDYAATTDSDSWTLLHAAVGSGKPEMLELILASGAGKELETPGGKEKMTALTLSMDQNTPVTVIERLLKAGANPNQRRDGYPLLFLAGNRPEAETLMKLLLAAGADAKAKADNGSTAPGFLHQMGEKGLPLFRLLIAAGADPQVLYNSVKGSVPVILSREFRYPDLAALKQVTLSLPQDGFTASLAKSADQPGGAPAGLPDLLLAAKGLRWITQLPPDWGTLRLFRRDAQGALKEEVVRDWMSGPAPALQWGDIVEFVSADWQLPDTRPNRNYDYNSNLPQELRNRLQAALVRHVTVTLSGKTWPMTLRGGLKVYNPLKPEAPLMDAVSLMKMMGAEDPRWFYAGVKVTRQADQGGGEITSALRNGAEIPLKEGDALELVGHPAAITLQNGGAAVQSPDSAFETSEVRGIVLLSPDLPFSGSLTVTGNSGRPGLIEFLAASWPAVGAEALKKMTDAEKTVRVTELTGTNAMEALAGEWPQSVLPHPDWAGLKIRRAAENGEFTEIPINLAAAIAACTDATTPEEARKSDVELKPADAIILPIRQDRRDQTWTGWDADTVRFFSKALSMQVTLADEDGSFRALNLEYLPLRYVETSAGLLGLPAAEPGPNRLNRFFVDALVRQAAPDRTFLWRQRVGSPDRDNQADGAALLPGDTIGVNAAPATIAPPAGGHRRVVLPSNP